MSNIFLIFKFRSKSLLRNIFIIPLWAIVMDVGTPAALTDLRMEMAAAPQAMVFTQPLTTSGPWEKHRKAISRIGSVEVVMGALSTVLGISAAIVAANASSSLECHFARKWSYSSQGIWCALFLATTGGLGISVRNKTSRGLYVANMTMAIIASIVLGVGVFLSIAAGLPSAIVCSQALAGLHACVSIICFASMVITIVHAACCCGGICCKGSSDPVLPYRSHSQQQIAHVAQNQYVYGPNDQMMILTSSSQAPNTPRQQEPPPAYAPPKATRNVKEGVLVEGLI